ncbi:MAG: hypothetical protein PHP42_01530 [Bacteroidota bacterium]|nr:hypothetical protein [Bacteroidota bacterium]
MLSNWDSVIGQQHVKEMLQTAIRHDRLAHAYFLWGSEGIGKDGLAIEFARTLLCEKNTDAACGECASCKKMHTLQHSNVKFIFPLPGGDSEKQEEEGEKLENDVLAEVREQLLEKAVNPYFHIAIPKAKFIRINSIRSLKKESSLSSVEGGKKIFLIFDADAMNDAAANSLLKILEEPLPNTHFVITSSRKDQVKPTIISRCQMVQCSMLTDDEIAGALVERKTVQEDQARFIARMANGSYRRALELLGEDLNARRLDTVAFLRSVLGNSSIKLFEEHEKYLSGNKREEAEQLLTLLLVWFRDAFVVREQWTTSVMNSDQQRDLQSFVAKFAERDIDKCMQAVERALELLRRNVYLPLVMLSLTVQLRRILNAKNV